MEEVYNFIRSEIDLKPNDTIVVGVSGGPDSMALLYILNEFKIKMGLKLICATFDEKLVRDDIEQIQTSGNNLLDIINNILDVSKIESGKDTLQEREYSINDMLVNIVNIAKSKIGAKPIKLAVNIDQNVSSVLYGDSAKLYQSLINIMGNAVKYTEVGTITSI